MYIQNYHDRVLSSYVDGEILALDGSPQIRAIHLFNKPTIHNEGCNHLSKCVTYAKNMFLIFV